jgi:DNA-binding MarR family transcriptional regulator
MIFGMPSDTQTPTQPPARLRALVSWQAGKVHVVGSRLTSARMPLNARSDFAVLAALEESGSITQADLGRRLGLDRNSINDIVNRLEAAGQAQRATDDTDRRRKMVTLTRAGRRYLDELQTATDAVQAELTAPLSDEELAHLQRLLDKILDAHPALPS